MPPNSEKPATVPKIAQLIAEARAYLNGFGISTEGKQGHEIIAMAREQRNKPRPPKR